VGHIDLYPTLLALIDVSPASRQKLDGVSYAAALKETGALTRAAFFNYFPHGRSPGGAGGVSVRSGDWKLIRWFGVSIDDPARHELYNLHDDLSEQKNLALVHQQRVAEFNKMIDDFLADTSATYPRPNPAFDRAVP
jgi:arylsulfatase A-like enzyme